MKNRFGFSEEECAILSRLDTPVKIQDYLDSLGYNLEEDGETCYSPRMVLRHRKANCIEGAVFAAAALRFHGHSPLIMDLECSKAWHDDDHVIALFRRKGLWGAISKSKYTGLGFREPIHRTLRELALTYFEGYFDFFNRKTLRGFSRKPVDLSIFDGKGWMTSEKSIKYIAGYLERIPHQRLITPGMARSLRRVTPLMQDAGELWLARKGMLQKLREGAKKPSKPMS